MVKYVGAFDDVIKAPSGHVVRFTKGEETAVPEDAAVMKAVRIAGHTLVEEKPAPVKEDPTPVATKPAPVRRKTVGNTKSKSTDT
jgi:hypothetical protein